MAIEILSSSEALAARRTNSHSDWPNRENGQSRLYPIASASQSVKFKINVNDKIFCIGSCFAREIESSLAKLGLQVLSKTCDLPNSANRNRGDAGFANKYTIGSILAELKNCLYASQKFEENFIKSGDKYVDCTLGGSSHPDTLENLTLLRAAFSKEFERIKKANVVVLTLGLSEVWFDKFAGTFLNVAPPLRAMKHEPTRFELHVLDYQETLEMLKDSIELITSALDHTVKILLTVSPVPLLTTFRQKDVFVSNSYSKAVLRAATEYVVTVYENVSYFPSYEIATLSNPTCVWSDKDFRHVDNSFVDHITSSAAMSIINQHDKSIQDQNVLARCKALYRSAFFKEAEAILLEAHGSDPSDYQINASVLRMAMINRRLENWERSLIFYNAYIKREPANQRAIEGRRIVQKKFKLSSTK